MSPDQFDEFFRTGLLRLPAALAPDVVHTMRERLWRFLGERRGIRADDRTTWPQGGLSGFQALSQAGAFAALACPMLSDVCDRILGVEGWSWPKTSAMPLVTFPQDGAWRLPHAAWHLDFAPRCTDGSLPGLRVLVFLAQTDPQGGGTVVLAGSHRLVQRAATQDPALTHSEQVRRLLARRHAWLRDLWSTQGAPDERSARFLHTSHRIDDVDLRVLALAGAAGDLIVMHPWLFHAAAPNCNTSPRLMLSWSVSVNLRA